MGRALRGKLGDVTKSRRAAGSLLTQSGRGDNLSEILMRVLGGLSVAKIVALEQRSTYQNTQPRIVYRATGTWKDAQRDYQVFQANGRQEYFEKTADGKTVVETRSYGDGELAITLRHGSRSSEKTKVNATIEISSAHDTLEFKYMKNFWRKERNEPTHMEAPRMWSRPKPVAEVVEGLNGFSLFD